MGPRTTCYVSTSGAEDRAILGRMRRMVAVLVVAVLVVGVAAVALGRETVQAVSSVDPDVTIECDGSTSVTEPACRAWGDEILALGAPSTTFEMQDLARLVVTKPLFGFGSPCQVGYFLQRYPEDAAWNADIPCRSRSED